MSTALDLLTMAPGDLAAGLPPWESGIAPGAVGIAVIEGGAGDWDAAAAAAPEALSDLNGAPVITLGVLREGELAAGSPDLLGRCDLVVSGGVDEVGGKVDELVELTARAPAPALVAAQLLRGGAGIATESFAYSMLLAGPDFRAWREGEPARPGGDAGAARVSVAEEAGAWVVRLTRPGRHNALDAQMREQLCDALDAIVASGSTAPIVLLGEGPSFCSGGDLDEFGSAADPVAAHLVRTARGPARRLRRLSGRLVAGVHGCCVGAGVELAAFATRVVASADATFSLPELVVGLNLGSGGAVSVPARIGRQRTLELLLRPDPIDAAGACEWGLVDRVVPAAELQRACLAAAAELEEAR